MVMPAIGIKACGHHQKVQQARKTIEGSACIARNDRQVLLGKMATGRTLKSNGPYFGYQDEMAIDFDCKRRLAFTLSRISHSTDTGKKIKYLFLCSSNNKEQK